jgi:hypothetical protein
LAHILSFLNMNFPASLGGRQASTQYWQSPQYSPAFEFVAASVGIEPTTSGLTVRCSTAELRGNILKFKKDRTPTKECVRPKTLDDE